VQRRQTTRWMAVPVTTRSMVAVWCRYDGRRARQRYYTVDNVLDVVTENAGEGTDLVNRSIAYALSSDVENLTLTGTAATSGTGK
jgi:hypothetical protein